MTRPGTISIRRWISLLLWGCIGAAVVLLVYPHLLAPIAATLRPYGPVPSIAAAVVVAGTLLRKGPRNAAELLGVRHPWRYPPAWFGGVFGSCTLLLAIMWSGKVDYMLDVETSNRGAVLLLITALVLASAALATLINVVALWTPGGSPEKRSTHIGTPLSPLTTSATELVTWISDDRELDDPSLDAFGHALVARRIAQRLVHPSTSVTAARTSALIGPRGSGKSTIGEFVRRYLEAQPGGASRTEFTSLSLWPYDTPEAAVRAVLERLVTVASTHADPVGLRGLPQEYVAMIESANGWLQGLAKSLHAPSTPDKALQQLSHILVAVRVSIVLWLDDLDRFADRGEDAASRLAPIRSLIYLLDRTPGIQVVLASTSLRDGFDLDKIARFIERPPLLQPLYVWRVLRCFRRHCLAGRGTEYLDYSLDTMALAAPEDDDDLAGWLMNWLTTHPTPQSALADILSTPRVLKDALRDCLARWTILKGEVDFDELLAMSAIRASRESDVFVYVCEHIALFRRHWKAAPTKDEEAAWQEQRARFNAIVDNVGTDQEHASIQTLLGFVFPQWDSGPLKLTPGPRPQSLSAEPYWSRYLSMSMDLGVPADQPTLRAIEAWRAKQPSDLIERMLNPTSVQYVEHYGFRFDRAELLRLLSETAQALLPLPSSSWADRHPPAIISLARLLRRRTPNQPELVDGLGQLLRLAVRMNLPLANALVYWLVHRSPNVSALLSQEDEERLTALVRKELSEWFSSTPPSALVHALRDGRPSTCWSLCVGHDGAGPAADNSPPFAEWPQFASALLAAAGTHAREVMPQLILFVVDHQDRFRDSSADDDSRPSIQRVPVFQRARAQAWFDFPALTYVITSTVPDPTWDTVIASYVAEAKDALLHRL